MEVSDKKITKILISANSETGTRPNIVAFNAETSRPQKLTFHFLVKLFSFYYSFNQLCITLTRIHL